MRNWIKLNATIVVAFGMLWGTTGAITASGLHVNLTDSLPRGIYQETREPITVGALVMECLPPELATLGLQRGWLMRGSCPTGAMPVLKRVGAVAGDTVKLGEFVTINGQVLLGTGTLFLDSQGRAIPQIARGEYMLKEGEVFLLADYTPTSWDSRYYGATKVTDIIATVKPLLTEEKR